MCVCSLSCDVNVTVRGIEFVDVEVMQEKGSSCHRTKNPIPVLNITTSGTFTLETRTTIKAAAVHVTGRNINVFGSINTSTMGYRVGPGTQSDVGDGFTMAGSYGGTGGGAWTHKPVGNTGFCNSNLNTNFTYCLDTAQLFNGACDDLNNFTPGQTFAQLPNSCAWRYAPDLLELDLELDCKAFGLGSGGSLVDTKPGDEQLHLGSRGGGFIKLTTLPTSSGCKGCGVCVNGLEASREGCVDITGSLQANGAPAGMTIADQDGNTKQWGGGSGGTVMITSYETRIVGNIGSGSITADGGMSNGTAHMAAGAGGGGRIAINSSVLSMAGCIADTVESFSCCFQERGFQHIHAAGGAAYCDGLCSSDPAERLEKQCCQRGGAGTIAISVAGIGAAARAHQYLAISGGASDPNSWGGICNIDLNAGGVSSFAVTPLKQRSANSTGWSTDLVLVGAYKVQGELCHSTPEWNSPWRSKTVTSPPVTAVVLDDRGNFRPPVNAKLKLRRRTPELLVNSSVRVMTGSVLYADGNLDLAADEITITGGQLGLQKSKSESWVDSLNVSSLNCTFRGVTVDKTTGSLAQLVAKKSYLHAVEVVRAKEGQFAISDLLDVQAKRLCFLDSDGDQNAGVIFGQASGGSGTAALPPTTVRLTVSGAVPNASSASEWKDCERTAMYAHMSTPTISASSQTSQTVPRLLIQIFSSSDADVALTDTQSWAQQLFVSAQNGVSISNVDAGGTKQLDSDVAGKNLPSWKLPDNLTVSAFCNRTVSSSPPTSFQAWKNGSWTYRLLTHNPGWNGVWVTSGGIVTVPQQKQLRASLVMLCASQGTVIAGAVNTSLQGHSSAYAPLTPDSCPACGKCIRQPKKAESAREILPAIAGTGAAHGGDGGYITAKNVSAGNQPLWWQCDSSNTTGCLPQSPPNHTECDGITNACLRGSSGGGCTQSDASDDDAPTSNGGGGNGGGVIFIDTPTLVMGSTDTAVGECKSSLLADAGDGFGGGGGGAGGTVWLHNVSNLTVSEACLSNLTAGVTPGFALMSACGGNGSEIRDTDMIVDGGAGSGGILRWFLSDAKASVAIARLGNGAPAKLDPLYFRVKAGTSPGSNSSAGPGIEINSNCPDGTGGVACIPCEMGQHSVDSGQDDSLHKTCNYCPSGHFSKKATSCTLCPLGRFCATNEADSFCDEQCTSCSNHHTWPDPATCGGYCPPASYSNHTGMAKQNCTACFAMGQCGGGGTNEGDCYPKFSKIDTLYDDDNIGLISASECSFTCDPGYVFSDYRCRNPLEAIVDSLGGISRFCAIVVLGLTALFVLWSKFMQDRVDRYMTQRMESKRGKRHQHSVELLLGSALVSPERQEHSRGLQDRDLTRHICRLYFSGHNKAKAPWVLSAKLATHLADVIDARKFALFAEQCNELARWDAPDTWQARVRYTVSFFCWPISAPLQRFMRIMRLRALQRYVKSYSHDFMKSVRSRTYEDSLKFGCSPDMTLAFLDILKPSAEDGTSGGSRPRGMSWAAGASEEAGREILPILLPCAGDGSLDAPFILDCNDILLKAVPSRLNMMIDDAWVIVIGELNDLLRVVSPSNIRATAQPALDYIAQVNRDSQNAEVLPERSLGSLRLHLAHHATDDADGAAGGQSSPCELPLRLPNGAKLGLLVTQVSDGGPLDLLNAGRLTPKTWFLGDGGRWTTRAPAASPTTFVRSPSPVYAVGRSPISGRSAFGTLPGSAIANQTTPRNKVRMTTRSTPAVEPTARPTPVSHERKKSSIREEALGLTPRSSHNRAMQHAASFAPARTRAHSEADDPGVMTAAQGQQQGYLDAQVTASGGRRRLAPLDTSNLTPRRAGDSPFNRESFGVTPTGGRFRTTSFDHADSPDAMAALNRGNMPSGRADYTRLIAYSGKVQAPQQSRWKDVLLTFFRSHFIMPRNTMFGHIWFCGSWHKLPQVALRTFEHPFVYQSLLLALIIIDFLCNLLVLVQFYCVPIGSERSVDSHSSCSKVRDPSNLLLLLLPLLPHLLPPPPPPPPPSLPTCTAALRAPPCLQCDTHTHILAVRLSPQSPFFIVLLVYPGAWVIAPFLGAIFVVSYFAIGRVVSRVRCRAHVRILCLTNPPLRRLASCPRTVLALERFIGCQRHRLLVHRKHTALGTVFELRARGSRAHRAVQQDTAVVRGLPLHRSERVLQGRARRRSELGLVRAQIIPWTLGGPPSGIREYGRLPMLRTGRRGREPSRQTARAH